jgi:hypothetical protein
MYAKYHHGGLGATQFAPLATGANEGVAMSACTKVGGTWLPEDLDTQNPNPAAGCNINIGESLPDWCSYVPFATSMFDECKLLSTPADLAAYGNYTAYQAAVNQGDPNVADTLLQQDLQQSQNLLDTQDCTYNAAANNPVLSQIFGPNNICNFTNADGSMNLLFYGVLALVGLVTIKLITK